MGQATDNFPLTEMSHCEHVETVPDKASQQSNATQATTCQVFVSTVFPTGLTSNQYPRSHKWKNRRWAWEFLTRNKDFRDFCDQVLFQNLPAAQVRQISLIKFGLLKFKDYREPYRPSLPKFSSAQANFWVDTSKGTFGDRKKKRTYMGPGEIIIRASLRDALQSKSRKALVKYIDTLLDRKATEWAGLNGVQPSSITVRGDFLALLRILDLVAFNTNQPKAQQKTRTQLYAIVFPKIANAPSASPPISGQFNKPFSEKWSLARKYTQPERYLSLAATI